MIFTSLTSFSPLPSFISKNHIRFFTNPYGIHWPQNTSCEELSELEAQVAQTLRSWQRCQCRSGEVLRFLKGMPAAEDENHWEEEIRKDQEEQHLGWNLMGFWGFFLEEVGVGKRSTIKLTDGVKVGNSSKTQQMRTRRYIFREVHCVSICPGNFGNCPDIMCHLISPQANGGFEMIYMDIICTSSTWTMYSNLSQPPPLRVL